MSRPRFLADHDLNERIVEGVLRHEPAAQFFLAREFGWQELPDDELLARAAKEGFIIVSHDVSTLSAAAIQRVERGEPMAGVLLVRQRRAFGDVIEHLVMIWTAAEAEEYANLIQYLPLRSP